jgi:hypothetical protein
MQLLSDLIQTFGPFLIPATLFVVGIAGYVALWILTGRTDRWADESDGDEESYEKL